MPALPVAITAKQQRVLEQKITRTGEGSVSSEIHNTIKQYLASPKQIEAAFFTLLKDKAPKDLPDLPALQAKLKRTSSVIDRTLKRVKASERRMAALDVVDTAAIGQLAVETFGSTKQAYAWLHRPHRSLGQHTPFSFLTSASGFKRVKLLLKRMAHDVPLHGGYHNDEGKQPLRKHHPSLCPYTPLS